MIQLHDRKDSARYVIQSNVREAMDSLLAPALFGVQPTPSFSALRACRLQKSHIGIRVANNSIVDGIPTFVASFEVTETSELGQLVVGYASRLESDLDIEETDFAGERSLPLQRVIAGFECQLQFFREWLPFHSVILSYGYLDLSRGE